MTETGRGPDILHVDMDAFFAAVEVLDDPVLAGRPVVVGGTGPRGVVASCSYEARARGVRSAMPTSQARSLCPSATFIPGRYWRYVEVSRQLHKVFVSFTPVVEGIALDEAFLDVGGAHALFGESETIAWAVRRQVRDELNLDCSVGVAASKLVAKLASEQAKPHAQMGATEPGRGVVVVVPGTELDFLHPLPVRSLWGVGPATAIRLRRFGVSTIADLAAVPLSSLINALGQSAGRRLHDLAWGRDERAVVTARPIKSIGHEETFLSDEYQLEVLHRQVVRMADAVGRRLRDNALAGRTITLKARYADFATVTRSRTLARPTSIGPEMARVAGDLLAKIDVHRGIRLLGVSLSQLEADPGQSGPGLGSGPGPGLTMRGDSARALADQGGGGGKPAGESSGSVGIQVLTFDDLGDPDRLDEPGDPGGAEGSASQGNANHLRRQASWIEATSAVDAIRQRYGPGAVGPGALIEGPRVRVKVQGDAQWGPTVSEEGPT
ncbi:MAG: DNA polymerase IV [Acidimicrobiales bacterium]